VQLLSARQKGTPQTFCYNFTGKIYEWMETRNASRRGKTGADSEQKPSQTNQTRATDDNPTRRTGRGQAPQDGRRGEGNPKPCLNKQYREPGNNLTRGTGGWQGPQYSRKRGRRTPKSNLVTPKAKTKNAQQRLNLIRTTCFIKP